jgi:hypothetical protein
MSKRTKRNKLRKHNTKRRYKKNTRGGGIYKLEHTFIPKDINDFTTKINDAYEIMKKIDNQSTIESQVKSQIENIEKNIENKLSRFKELYNKYKDSNTIITPEDKEEIKRILLKIEFDKMNTKIYKIIIDDNNKLETNNTKDYLLELSTNIRDINKQLDILYINTEKLEKEHSKIPVNRENIQTINDIRNKINTQNAVYNKLLDTLPSLQEKYDKLTENTRINEIRKEYEKKINKIKDLSTTDKDFIGMLQYEIQNTTNAENNTNTQIEQKTKELTMTNKTSHTVWFYKNYNKDKFKKQMKDNEAKALFANLSDVNKSIIKIPATFYNTNGNKQINIYNTLSSGYKNQNIKFLDYDIPLSECNIRISLDVSYVRDKLTNIKDNILPSDSIFIPPEYKKTYGNLNSVNPSIDNVVPTKNSTSDNKVV